MIVLNVSYTDFLGVKRSGRLQYFEYEATNRFKSRKVAWDRAEKARMRWASNYAQYRDAQFSIVDMGAI